MKAIVNSNLINFYDKDGKLKQYPSKKSKRIIALSKIAEGFEHSKKYNEKEVNEIIRNNISFNDIELIRREMFIYNIIGRLRDGSEYWLEENWQEKIK